MSISWYVNRLARMSVNELAHRVGEQVKRRVSKRQTYGWNHFTGETDFKPLPNLKVMFEAVKSNELRDAIHASSACLLAGEFGALGVMWPKRDPEALFPRELWRLDPVTTELWPGPEQFCFDISYRHERKRGDIKYVWEINRLQFLQPLAASYALFEDQKAVAAIDRALVSWTVFNPPFQGLGWNSGIEIALRAVSILIVVSLCGEALKAETQRLINPFLKAHFYWLARYPSRFSSANNHRVAELMAMFLISSSLDMRRPVRHRLGQALAREAALQILPDGAPAEQSPTYGAFTAEMLLLSAAIAKANGERLQPIVDKRLELFADFIAALAGRNGLVPAIGDDDEGRVINLCAGHEPTYCASVARAIKGYLGAQTPFSEMIDFRDAFFAPPSVSSPLGDGILVFRDGGYTIVRTTRCGRRLRLILDHGPLGFLSIAAHGHADANAIVLGIDDEPVFIDPGTYLYHSGGEWRDWFRGTAAHNTLNLLGTDQSLITGPFNWAYHAEASLQDIRTEEPWSIAVGHDGYVKKSGVEHRRRVTALQDGFVINDVLHPAGTSREAVIVFQLAPDLSVREEGHVYVLSRKGADLVRMSFEEAGQTLFFEGEPGVWGGWSSPSFGLKVPAIRLVWTGYVPPEGVNTRIEIVPV